MGASHWKNYVNTNGDFELGSYLYRTITDLMKTSLDMGTLLSNDPAKLRSFKESLKNIYKKRWEEVAQSLETFEIIVPCGCQSDVFCRACSGSRYRLNQALSPDEMKETFIFVAADKDAKEIEEKLLGAEV